MRQAWVPRVFNLVMAALLLLFLVPIVLDLGRVGLLYQIFLVLVGGLLLLPLVLACLCSAVRPGSLGRAARRLRACRQR
jgi:hypothetical protein